MTWWLLAPAVALLLVVGAWWVERSSGVRRRLRSRVLVTLKSGSAFDGVLTDAGRAVWVLRSVHAIGAGDRDANIAVDGEVIVFTADIDYVQKP